MIDIIYVWIDTSASLWANDISDVGELKMHEHQLTEIFLNILNI